MASDEGALTSVRIEKERYRRFPEIGIGAEPASNLPVAIYNGHSPYIVTVRPANIRTPYALDPPVGIQLS